MKRHRLHISRKGILLVALVSLVIFILLACAPQKLPTSNSGTKDVDPVEISWSPSIDCAVCHQNENSSYLNDACEASQHQDEKCIDCHTNAEALQQAHRGVTTDSKMPNRLKKTKVDDAVCLNCHYQTRKALIKATNELAHVTDTEGNSYNPHDTEGISEHDSLLCANCHNMHSSEDLQKRALAQCKSCHHAGVFQCYTCHD